MAPMREVPKYHELSIDGQHQIQRWLKMHDIDPNRATRIRYEPDGDSIVTVYEVNDQGNPYIPEGGNKPATHEVTVEGAPPPACRAAVG